MKIKVYFNSIMVSDLIINAIEDKGKKERELDGVGFDDVKVSTPWLFFNETENTKNFTITLLNADAGDVMIDLYGCESFVSYEPSVITLNSTYSSVEVIATLNGISSKSCTTYFLYGDSKRVILVDIGFIQDFYVYPSIDRGDDFWLDELIRQIRIYNIEAEISFSIDTTECNGYFTFSKTSGEIVRSTEISVTSISSVDINCDINITFSTNIPEKIKINNASQTVTLISYQSNRPGYIINNQFLSFYDETPQNVSISTQTIPNDVIDIYISYISKIKVVPIYPESCQLNPANNFICIFTISPINYNFSYEEYIIFNFDTNNTYYRTLDNKDVSIRYNSNNNIKADDIVSI